MTPVKVKVSEAVAPTPKVSVLADTRPEAVFFAELAHTPSHELMMLPEPVRPFI